jgi:hypothetical protein
MSDELKQKIEVNRQKALAKKRQREEREREEALIREQEQIMDE